MIPTCVRPSEVNCAWGGDSKPAPFSDHHAALIAKREELRTLLRQLGGGIAVQDVREPMEAQVNGVSRELAVAQIRSTRERLAQVNCALKRIELSEYGRCISCDEEIAEKRLTVVPWAAECIECAAGGGR